MEKKIISLTKNNEADTIYKIPNFYPKIVNEQYLKEIGININLSENVLESLYKGSLFFKDKFEHKTILPDTILKESMEVLSDELEIHNYTGKCPTNTFEVNPVKGCHVGCLYCLVTDGIHNGNYYNPNYPSSIRKHIEIHKNDSAFYYFSPKTEAFQMPTLQTGVAHQILIEFIRFFEKNPNSKLRVFIASKAGIENLNYKYEGNSILHLLTELSGKVQFNTSLTILPEKYRVLLEPNASPITERLKAVEACQKNNVLSNSALIQPIIIPLLSDKLILDFLVELKNVGIINIKPEFMTLCPENLVVISQILGHFDKKIEKELYEHYLPVENLNHIKQRNRIAPLREKSNETLMKIKSISEELGISISICYWVRNELKLNEIDFPLINKNGYQCLGYQTLLFE